MSFPRARTVVTAACALCALHAGRGHAQSTAPVIAASSVTSQRWQTVIGGQSVTSIYLDPPPVELTGDGGAVLFGRYTPQTGGDTVDFAMKLGADGKPRWSNAYDRSGRSHQGVVQTADGGYVLIPNLYGPMYGEPPAVATKLGSDGRIQWQTQNLPSPDSAHDPSSSWVVANDGGIYLTAVAAYYDEDQSRLVIRTEPDGTIAWSQTFDCRVYPCEWIEPDPDGGFFVVGWLAGNLAGIRVDSKGRIVWNQVIVQNTNPTNPFDFDQVLTAPNGGLLFAGVKSHRQNSPYGDYDPYLFLMDPDGQVTWVRKFNTLTCCRVWDVVPMNTG